MEKILLVDGHSMLHRAYFGVPKLTNSKGNYTNAIYGFLNILFKVLEDEEPQYLMVAFDLSAPTFRHKIFADYKGTRKPMDDELRVQIPVMKDVLRSMNIPIMEVEGLEADDILGTMAKRSEAQGLEVCILSGDRDLLQLATDRIKIKLPHTIKGKTTVEDMYAEDVLKKYQVTPAGIIELKALMGDSSDNIPGVPRVGEKTATELVVKYGCIENLKEHLDEITKKALHATLVENFDMAEMSKVLATINTTADIPFSYEQGKINDLYNEKAYELFKELEFKNYLNRFEDKEAAAKSHLIEIAKNDYKKILEEALMAKCVAFTVDFSENDNLSQDSNLTPIEKMLMGEADAKNEINYIDLCFNEEAVYRLTGDSLKQDFEAFLRNAKCDIYTQDIKRTLKVINIEEKDNIHDIVLLAYLLDPNRSKYEFEVDQIYRLGKEYEEKLKEIDEYSLYTDIEKPLTYTLSRMEKEGIVVKPSNLRELSIDLSQKLSALEKSIHSQAGEEFNINSPKQLGEILFVKMGLEGGKKTASGAYSTSAEVLDKLAVSVPFVKDVLEYRTLSKLKSTYADGLANFIDSNNLIHTTFQQTVTATGRLSSTDPNLQNIPIRYELGRSIRKVFVPREGNIFIDADYSQIELRLLAHMSGDKGLIDAFNNGEDIHASTASKVFNVPIDEVTALQRRNAKAVNFGIVYGISAFGLSQDLNISRKEAQGFIDSYFESYPRIHEYLEELKNNAIENGYSITLYNRRRPIPELMDKKTAQFGQRVAMNAPIQGSAADIMKLAMINVERALNDNNLKAKMLLQVHDEILIDSPIEEKETVKKILVKEMENAAKLSVPLLVDVHEGINWYEAK